MDPRHQRTWFRAYCDAVFEMDRNRINQRVASAHQAIAIRVAELQTGAGTNPREFRDLGDAIRNLQLLVKHPVA